MRRSLVVFVISLLLFTSVHAGNLSPDIDSQLSDVIRSWSGEQNISASSMSDLFGYQPVKCGTPAIMSVWALIPYASPKVQQEYSAMLRTRYDFVATDSIGSPGGHFLMHYSHQISSKPAYADQDNNHNGIPDYVDETGAIFDSVWEHEIGDLGYTAPLADGFYSAGIDDRYDVYIFDLDVGANLPGVYGATFPDSTVNSGGHPRATSFIIIENDFKGAAFGDYQNRPLDAVRVTAAHEFFHAIQLGYDPFEFEKGLDQYDPRDDRTTWMEMSAVWMEEQNYDYINDYYNYLPVLFDHCNWSLRTGALDNTLRSTYEYAAVVWPLYLSKTFGQDIVRQIWDSCTTRSGPNVFQNAFDDVITDVSSGQYDFASALSEFYVWDYFTSYRAIDGFGFEEAADFAYHDYFTGLVYPAIVPEFVPGSNPQTPFIQEFRNFPITNYYPGDLPPIGTGFISWPDYLGANYIRLKPAGLDSIRFFLDGEAGRMDGPGERDSVEFDWQIRVANINFEVGGGTVKVDPVIYHNFKQLTAYDVDKASEILLTLVPYAPTKYNEIHESVRYRFTVPDSSRPILQATISDPYPNPFVLSEAPQGVVTFKIEQPAQGGMIKMDVFSLSGEKVTETALTGKDFITWNGRNAAGAIVASGVYLVYITVGDKTEVYKVAVVE